METSFRSGRPLSACSVNHAGSRQCIGASMHESGLGPSDRKGFQFRPVRQCHLDKEGHGDEILFKLCRACLDAFAQKSCRNFGRCSSARAANMVPGCKAHGWCHQQTACLHYQSYLTSHGFCCSRNSALDRSNVPSAAALVGTPADRIGLR
jgi:hypothetical protein